MALYKPSELAKHLDNLGISPKKRLSQNFLLDGNVIGKIVTLASIEADDIVLEIGPGPGALTEALLAKGAYVIAIEKDRVLAEALKQMDPLKGKLEVHCADILEFPLVELLSQKLKKGQKAKVVANLPYSITTPIMTRLAPLNDLISTIVVMVQDEVAKRFVGSPGTKEYGSITVFLNFYSKCTYGFKVSRNCFFPRPNVSSAIVKLTLHTPLLESDVTNFFILTRTAFGKRRKTMKSSLKELYNQDAICDSLKAIGLKETSRPEELSAEQFVALYHQLHTR